MKTNIILLDTETNDKDNPVPLQIAYLYLSRNFNVVEEFYSNFNPEAPISYGAMATHHILPEDVKDCPPYSSFIFPEGVEYMIGHNIDFDWCALGQPEVKRIDTLAICRHLFPGVDSHTQSSMLYFFYGSEIRPNLKEAHNAYCDVENCAKLLKKLVEVIEKRLHTPLLTIEELYNFSEMARIPTIIPFGKHKGMKIKDLPKDYVQWLLRQPELDPYLEKALKG
jgi:exodeoxyribonuclease X